MVEEEKNSRKETFLINFIKKDIRGYRSSRWVGSQPGGNVQEVSCVLMLM